MSDVWREGPGPGEWSLCPVLGEGQGLYSEVQCIMGNGHIPPPNVWPDRHTRLKTPSCNSVGNNNVRSRFI